MFFIINNAFADYATVINGNCKRSYYYNISSYFNIYETCYEDETFSKAISSKSINFSERIAYGYEYTFDFTTGELYNKNNPNERYSIDQLSRSEYVSENGVSHNNHINIRRDSEGNIISQTGSDYTPEIEYDPTTKPSMITIDADSEKYRLQAEYDENGNKTHELKYDRSAAGSLCGAADGVSSNSWYSNSPFGSFNPYGTQGKTVSVQESYYTYDDEGRPLSRDGTSCSVDAEGNFYDDNCQKISSCTPAFSEIYTYGANGSCEMTNLLEGYSRACDDSAVQQPRRLIYTVKEATEAIQGHNNKNTFILRYR